MEQLTQNVHAVRDILPLRVSVEPGAYYIVGQAHLHCTLVPHVPRNAVQLKHCLRQ